MAKDLQPSPANISLVYIGRDRKGEAWLQGVFGHCCGTVVLCFNCLTKAGKTSDMSEVYPEGRQHSLPSLK